MRRFARCVTSAISAVVVLSCGGSSPPEPVTPGPPPRPAVSSDWREVVPAGPQAVVGMNITSLSRSSLVKAAVESLAAQDPGSARAIDTWRALTANCNMDVSRDLHFAVAAFYYDERTSAVAAVLKGSFDEAKIVDCATRLAERMNSALSTVEISGYKVYSSPEDPSTLSPTCVPEAGLMLVASDLQTMEAMLAADTPRFGSERTQLSTLLFELPQERSLWGAVTIPPESSIARYMHQATSRSLSRPAQAIYGHVEIDDGIDGQVGMVLASAQDASLLLAWVNKQLAMLRPALELQGLGSLLESLGVAAQGERLRVSLSLGPGDIEKLLQAAQQ